MLRLGKDLRSARLRRRMAIHDLAVRAGTSPSTIARLERGDPGVGIGTLTDVLVVFGLNDRLADLIDIRHDDLGLALSNARLPQRGRSFAAHGRQGSKDPVSSVEGDASDGLAF